MKRAGNQSTQRHRRWAVALTAFVLVIVTGILALRPPMPGEASIIRRDEHVIFFPTAARLDTNIVLHLPVDGSSSQMAKVGDSPKADSCTSC